MTTVNIPKTKIYDGVPYKFYNSYSTKSPAEVEAKRFRKDGLESRVQKRKYGRGDNRIFYVVWYYGGSTRAAIKKYGGK